MSQNIVFNILNGVLNNDHQERNINNGVFINIEYENWYKKMSIKKKTTPLEESAKVSRPRHKKSLSDTLNKMTPDLDLNTKESFKDTFDIFGNYRSDALAALTMRRKSSRFETSVLAAIEKNYNNLLEGKGGVWPLSPSNPKSTYIGTSPGQDPQHFTANDTKFIKQNQEEKISFQAEIEKKTNDLKIFLQNSSQLDSSTGPLECKDNNKPKIFETTFTHEDQLKMFQQEVKISEIEGEKSLQSYEMLEPEGDPEELGDVTNEGFEFKAQNLITQNKLLQEN